MSMKPFGLNTKRTFKTLAVCGLASMSLINKGEAMNHNLAWPWADKCSPPQTPYLAFHSPQSETLIFEDGSTIEIVCQAGLRSVGMTWTLHRNMVNEPFRKGKAVATPANGFKISIDTAGLHPGFYDLKVALDTGIVNKEKDQLAKRPVNGMTTFGWKVSSIQYNETRPADFRAFWDKAVTEYAKVPLDPKVEDEVKTFKGKEIDDYNVKSACLPPSYDPDGCKFDEVESCKISFAGPDGGRVYAWLAKPKGPGPFPAMLVLPGAGFAARSRPLEHARHGYLAIDVQVHGQDVDLEKYEQIPGYVKDFVYDPPEKFYYKNLYLRAARAVDYLCSRPDVDKTRGVVTCGGSQGGRLSVIVPALNKQVTATIPAIAHCGNYPMLDFVYKCNGSPEVGAPAAPGAKLSDGMELKGAAPIVDTPAGRCMAYYDPMNFAPDVKCPAFFNAGLTDPCSPPYSLWAIFTRIGSKDKTIVPLPNLAHDWSAEFDRRAWRWLEGKR